MFRKLQNYAPAAIILVILQVRVLRIHTGILFAGSAAFKFTIKLTVALQIIDGKLSPMNEAGMIRR